MSLFNKYFSRFKTCNPPSSLFILSSITPNCYLTNNKKFSSHRKKFIPEYNQASAEEIDRLQSFIDTKSRLFVLTGAGLSTESGLPDYRSKGVGLYEKSNHKPIQHNDFVSKEISRKKYWARNYAGWEMYEEIKPNKCHYKMQQLEAKNKVLVHVTQNVDSLNTKAGVKEIVELHGAMTRVMCLNCDAVISRRQLQNDFKKLNHSWSANIIDIRPDADAYIRDEDIVDFKVPPCGSCGGALKPDVVFFGDNVNKKVVEDLYNKVEESDGVLVLGSSLFIWSGYRFVRHAHLKGIPIVIINIGKTRGDDLSFLKIDSRCSEVLEQVCI